MTSTCSVLIATLLLLLPPGAVVCELTRPHSGALVCAASSPHAEPTAAPGSGDAGGNIIIAAAAAAAAAVE